MIPAALWRALLAVAAAVTAWLLLAPSPPEPPGPAGIADLGAHVALFAADAVLASLAFRGTPRWRLWIALVAFGAVAEVVQGLVGRTPSALDLLADGVGAAAVWLVPRAARQ